MRSGADQNGDNLRIFRACLQISDHCRVMVRARVRVRFADCCMLEKVTKCGSIT